jgi:hypothetical protein
MEMIVDHLIVVRLRSAAIIRMVGDHLIIFLMPESIILFPYFFSDFL